MTANEDHGEVARVPSGEARTARLGAAVLALGTLTLTHGPSAALAGHVSAAASSNRVYADCVLNTNGQGPNSINTLAGLAGDILAKNSNNPNDVDLGNVTISYVVVYAVSNDNNGQPIVNGNGGPVLGHSGVVICVNPNILADPVSQTEDLNTIDILDLQESLILRHNNGGANRLCHTTDANTDCFDIQ